MGKYKDELAPLASFRNMHHIIEASIKDFFDYLQKEDYPDHFVDEYAKLLLVNVVAMLGPIFSDFFGKDELKELVKTIEINLCRQTQREVGAKTIERKD